LTASFSTASAAGVSSSNLVSATSDGAHATDTGIQISGPGVSVGTTPGIVGTLSLAAGANGTTGPSESADKLEGNATIVGSDGQTHVINLTAGPTGTGTTGETLDQLETQINQSGWGVTASVSNSGTAGALANISTLTLTSSNSNVSANLTGIVDTTEDGEASDGTETDVASGTGPKGSTDAIGAYYSTGVTTGATLKDVTTNTQISSNLAAQADTNGTGGTATISYSDQAGQTLSNTDLTNQTNAETALTSLNSAIVDVAAQDGYIGAQINTLNAVSSVLSTQSENVQSAQNAVQATDYASATSNMSKYEILSQTGISALAQANSMQQEVTKLLQ
jgi:flagellin